MQLYCNAGPNRCPAFGRALSWLALVIAMPAAAQPPLPTVSLSIGHHTIQVELADTPARMRDGLMDRTTLARDDGMLFVLGPPDSAYCFWMKNTLLPLSIAFMDTQGRIVSIQDMQAQSLQPHCPPSPITTALEMNQGWFTTNGVGVGTLVNGLPPPPQQPWFTKTQ
ncbi:MAG TPA: DUF192 domain-containing protein [Castellaniella sp.]|uniref:DUF192 domain-containing protein n=1 Tax=Castellaniella sp. TaxID=1955812 RepID=UPI002F0E84CC